MDTTFLVFFIWTVFDRVNTNFDPGVRDKPYGIRFEPILSIHLSIARFEIIPQGGHNGQKVRIAADAAQAPGHFPPIDPNGARKPARGSGVQYAPVHAE